MKITHNIGSHIRGRGTISPAILRDEGQHLLDIIGGINVCGEVVTVDEKIILLWTK